MLCGAPSRGGNGCHSRKTKADNASTRPPVTLRHRGDGRSPVTQRNRPRDTRATSTSSDEIGQDPHFLKGPHNIRPGLAGISSQESAPRFITQGHPDAVGSFGPVAREWIAETLGITLRDWQQLVIDEALVHDDAGELLRDEVLLTVPRQQGKSVLMRAVALWRLAHPDLFGGHPQQVLHTAARMTAGREIWEAGARDAERHLGAKLYMSGGRERANLPDGGRYLLMAATPSLAVGYTLDLAMVDEAWNVEARPVDHALVPTLIEHPSSQLWLVSTAGDSSSSLLRERRLRALSAVHAGDGSGGQLLIEWSAPEDAAVDDPEAWRVASPHWTPRREAFLAAQLERLPESAFRQQFLNQWVLASGGWLEPSKWDEARNPDIPAKGQPLAAAVEVSVTGNQHSVVAVWAEPAAGYVVRAYMVRDVDGVNGVLGKLAPLRVLASPAYKERLDRDDAEQVSRAELIAGTPVAYDLLQRCRVVHDGDPFLAEQVLSARAYRTESGWCVSSTRSTGPVHAVRAMVWALHAASQRAGAAPRIYTRTAARRPVRRGA